MPLDLAIAPLTGARNNPAAAEELARWRRALEQAKENTAVAQRRQKKYADRHRRAAKFAVGDRVLLATQNLKLLGEARRTRKFTERYIGPYRVKRVVNDNAYELELPARWRIHPVINVSRLKEYHDGTAAFPDRPTPLTRPPPVAVNEDGEGDWAVERILDHRRQGRRRTLQYLVHWKGYPQYEATWEPVENLDGALELVTEYNRSRNIDLGTVVELSVAQSSAWRQPLRMRTTAELRGLSSVSQTGGGCNRASRKTTTTSKGKEATFIPMSKGTMFIPMSPRSYANVCARGACLAEPRGAATAAALRPRGVCA
jgi:hypothetical protein